MKLDEIESPLTRLLEAKQAKQDQNEIPRKKHPYAEYSPEEMRANPILGLIAMALSPLRYGTDHKTAISQGFGDMKTSLFKKVSDLRKPKTPEPSTPEPEDSGIVKKTPVPQYDFPEKIMPTNVKMGGKTLNDPLKFQAAPPEFKDVEYRVIPDIKRLSRKQIRKFTDDELESGILRKRKEIVKPDTYIDQSNIKRPMTHPHEIGTAFSSSPKSIDYTFVPDLPSDEVAKRELSRRQEDKAAKDERLANHIKYAKSKGQELIHPDLGYNPFNVRPLESDEIKAYRQTPPTETVTGIDSNSKPHHKDLVRMAINAKNLRGYHMISPAIITSPDGSTSVDLYHPKIPLVKADTFFVSNTPTSNISHFTMPVDSNQDPSAEDDKETHEDPDTNNAIVTALNAALSTVAKGSPQQPSAENDKETHEDPDTNNAIVTALNAALSTVAKGSPQQPSAENDPVADFMEKHGFDPTTPFDGHTDNIYRAHTNLINSLHTLISKYAKYPDSESLNLLAHKLQTLPRTDLENLPAKSNKERITAFNHIKNVEDFLSNPDFLETVVKPTSADKDKWEALKDLYAYAVQKHNYNKALRQIEAPRNTPEALSRVEKTIKELQKNDFKNEFGHDPYDQAAFKTENDDKDVAKYSHFLNTITNNYPDLLKFFHFIRKKSRDHFDKKYGYLYDKIPKGGTRSKHFAKVALDQLFDSNNIEQFVRDQNENETSSVVLDKHKNDILKTLNTILDDYNKSQTPSAPPQSSVVGSSTSSVQPPSPTSDVIKLYNLIHRNSSTQPPVNPVEKLTQTDRKLKAEEDDRKFQLKYAQDKNGQKRDEDLEPNFSHTSDPDIHYFKYIQKKLNELTNTSQTTPDSHIISDFWDHHTSKEGTELQNVYGMPDIYHPDTHNPRKAYAKHVVASLKQTLNPKELGTYIDQKYPKKSEAEKTSIKTSIMKFFKDADDSYLSSKHDPETVPNKYEAIHRLISDYGDESLQTKFREINAEAQDIFKEKYPYKASWTKTGPAESLLSIEMDKLKQHLETLPSTDFPELRKELGLSVSTTSQGKTTTARNLTAKPTEVSATPVSGKTRGRPSLSSHKKYEKIVKEVQDISTPQTLKDEFNKIVQQISEKFKTAKTPIHNEGTTDISDDFFHDVMTEFKAHLNTTKGNSGIKALVKQYHPTPSGITKKNPKSDASPNVQQQTIQQPKVAPAKSSVTATPPEKEKSSSASRGRQKTPLTTIWTKLKGDSKLSTEERKLLKQIETDAQSKNGEVKVDDKYTDEFVENALDRIAQEISKDPKKYKSLAKSYFVKTHINKGESLIDTSAKVLQGTANASEPEVTNDTPDKKEETPKASAVQIGTSDKEDNSPAVGNQHRKTKASSAGVKEHVKIFQDIENDIRNYKSKEVEDFWEKIYHEEDTKYFEKNNKSPSKNNIPNQEFATQMLTRVQHELTLPKNRKLKTFFEPYLNPSSSSTASPAVSEEKTEDPVLPGLKRAEELNQVEKAERLYKLGANRTLKVDMGNFKPIKLFGVGSTVSIPTKDYFKDVYKGKIVHAFTAKSSRAKNNQVMYQIKVTLPPGHEDIGKNDAYSAPDNVKYIMVSSDDIERLNP